MLTLIHVHSARLRAAVLPHSRVCRAGGRPVSNGGALQLLRDGRARTRAELAEVTGLARSTVAARVDALSSVGLIGPAGEAFSSGGRPPSRFAFQPSARIVMAVDVGATHILVAATDLSGRVLTESRVDIEISAGPHACLTSS